MDFLNPTIETIQASLNSAWKQVPPPVQQAAPFVGVAVGSGLLVFLVQQRRINNQVRCARFGCARNCVFGTIKDVSEPVAALRRRLQSVDRVAGGGGATSQHPCCHLVALPACHTPACLQRQRSDELQVQVVGLQKERLELLRRVNTLKVGRRGGA